MNFIDSAISNRGFGKDFIKLPKDNLPISITVGLILINLFAKFWVRLEWIDYAQANYVDENGETVYLRPNMVKDGVALPNTHDSFYFGSIVQKVKHSGCIKIMIYYREFIKMDDDHRSSILAH